MRKKRKSYRKRNDTSTKARKTAKKKEKIKEDGLVRNRNAGTWTESMFWAFIRSSLRSKSRWWKPILNTKKKAKRAYNGPNKRQRFEYKCAICGEYFPDKLVTVDHIVPIGSLKGASDLPKFVETLFCEGDNLQTACKSCHDAKTKKEREERL